MNHQQKLLSFLNGILCKNERHRPFWRIGNSKRIVLFLHGIQGSPSQFRWLANSLPEDTDYISLLLPGHGAAAAVFRQNGIAEWLKAVWTVLDCVLPVYEQVDLVGHSMGCLIWLLAHQKYSGRFHGMFFLNCPFSLRPTMRYVRNNLLSLSDRPTRNCYIQAAREANSLSTLNPLAYLFCYKPYRDLLQLIRTAKSLPKMQIINGFAYFSQMDEIVSLKSLNTARQMYFQTTVLPLCGHNYFTPEAKKLIEENFLQMISQSK